LREWPLTRREHLANKAIAGMADQKAQIDAIIALKNAGQGPQPQPQPGPAPPEPTGSDPPEL
jgi:hypothetical protein